MKNRLILVINPRSSGFDMIQKKIISRLCELNLSKNQLKVFEIQPTNPLSNAKKMSEILQDGDSILVAGGDGTAHIATNAAVFSEAKNLKMKFLGFGNFNDYAHSFSKNTVNAALKSLQSGKISTKIKPLKIKINGNFFRTAPLYATVGLTAEMAEIFEHPRVRSALKKTSNRNTRLVFSLLASTRFYFKNRKKHTLKIAKIWIDGKKQAKIIKSPTDLVFMNGPRMARIMRSKLNKIDTQNFGFGVLNSGDFLANIPFLLGGIFGKIPLKRVKFTEVEFTKPQEIHIQIEGESSKIKNVEKIEVSIIDTEIGIL